MVIGHIHMMATKTQKSSQISSENVTNQIHYQILYMEVHDLKTIFPYVYDMIAKKPDYLLTLGLKLRFYITYIRCMPCAVLLLSSEID